MNQGNGQAGRTSSFTTFVSVLCLVATQSAFSSPSGKCSIANGEQIKIASWGINELTHRARVESGTFDEFVSMVRIIDADVFAFQKVSPEADEIVELAAALNSDSRCYRVMTSAMTNRGKYALLYDAREVEMLYPVQATAPCDPTEPVSVIDSAPLMQHAVGVKTTQTASQLAFFRATADEVGKDGRFDFAVVNVNVGEDRLALDEFAQDVASLSDNYPWLSGELDIVVVGHLGDRVSPGQLRGSHFRGMKPLINPLLMISLGLSDISFDEAVRQMSGGGGRPPSGQSMSSMHYDNLLVRRWDRPGRCDSALYCGGLEEFISARVYRHDKVFNSPVKNSDETVSDHDPVAARFCKFADSDLLTEVKSQVPNN